MKSLKCYRPTPWLINGHIHTIWGMKFKGRTKYIPQREDINFEYGGQVTIEHFVEGKTPNNAPIFSSLSIQWEEVKKALHPLEGL